MYFNKGKIGVSCIVIGQVKKKLLLWILFCRKTSECIKE